MTSNISELFSEIFFSFVFFEIELEYLAFTEIFVNTNNRGINAASNEHKHKKSLDINIIGNFKVLYYNFIGRWFTLYWFRLNIHKCKRLVSCVFSFFNRVKIECIMDAYEVRDFFFVYLKRVITRTLSHFESLIE